MTVTVIVPGGDGSGGGSFGAGIADFLVTPSSANLKAAITDETGSGSLVFGTSPTFTGHVTIEGVTVTGATGTGAFVFGTGPTLTTATLGAANGTVGAPSINFTSDTDNGFYRIGANDWAGSAGGVKVIEFIATGVQVLALGVGQAPAAGYGIVISAPVSSNACIQAAQLDTAATTPNSNWLHKATSGNNLWHQFMSDAGDTIRGQINYNRGGGLVAYGTTSDYRLKDIDGPFSDSGAMFDAIPVHLGKMKDATLWRPMFLAHEVQAVMPWAVSGEKDAADEDGKIIAQQLDKASMIEAMWAEIQSLRSRVAVLEAN